MGWIAEVQRPQRLLTKTCVQITPKHVLLDYFNYPQSSNSGWHSLPFRSHSKASIWTLGEAPMQTRGRGQSWDWLIRWKMTEPKSLPSQSRPKSAFIQITEASAYWRLECWRTDRSLLVITYTLKVLWIFSLHWWKMAEIRLTQPSNRFAIFLTNSSSSVWVTAEPTTLPASNLIWKHLSSLSSSSPASSSSSSHSSSSSFLLFTTSTHAQLLSTLVLGESVLFASVYVLFYYISTHFLQFFLFVLFFSCMIRRFRGSVTRVMPRADEVPSYYGSLAEVNEANLLIILLKEARHSRFDLVQRKPKYMRFKHKYIQGVGVPLKRRLGRSSSHLLPLWNVLNM